MDFHLLDGNFSFVFGVLGSVDGSVCALAKDVFLLKLSDESGVSDLLFLDANFHNNNK